MTPRPGTSRQGPAQVVVVNGPAGIRKTTISRRLAAAVSNGVCVHGDALRAFLLTRDPDRPAGLTYVAAAAFTGVYLAAGFDRVVVDYILEAPAHLDRFRAALPPDTPEPRVITLWAPLPVVQAREAARPGRDRLDDRVEEVLTRIDHALSR